MSCLQPPGDDAENVKPCLRLQGNVTVQRLKAWPKKTGFSCPFGRVLLENGRVLNAKWTKSIQLEFLGRVSNRTFPKDKLLENACKNASR